MTENTGQDYQLGQALEQYLENISGVQRVRGLESLHARDNTLRMNITLCPLYAQGEMNQSRLLDSANAVLESRVVRKWEVGIAIIQTLHKALENHGIKMHVMFTLADLGVITDQSIDKASELLERHRAQYVASARQAFEVTNITWGFQSYTEMGINFPQIIHPTEVPEARSRRINMVDQLYEELVHVVSFADNAIYTNDIGQARFSKRARKIVGSMIEAFGYELAKLFLLQYGTFDAVTSRGGDINCYLERGDLLLNITNLFPHGNDPERSRLDIRV